jgi:uncharacterized caspase-like protein
MTACLPGRKYLALLLALTFSAASRSRAEGPPAYYVLAIGVNKYKMVPPLSGAVNDAKQVADLFKRQGARTVRLMTDEEATYNNVVGALEKFRKRTPDFRNLEEVRPGEVVVIYMAGHGLRSGGKWWFAPHDFNGAAPPYNVTLVQDTQILSAACELMAAGHRVVLILDCCFAGQIRYSAEWKYQVNDLAKVDDPNAGT